MRGNQLGNLRHDLRDRSRRGHVVQRNGNLESIFELRDQFEHLERIEAEVGHQIVLERRLDRPPADMFQDVDDPCFDEGQVGLGHRVDA